VGSEKGAQKRWKEGCAKRPKKAAMGVGRGKGGETGPAFPKGRCKGKGAKKEKRGARCGRKGRPGLNRNVDRFLGRTTVGRNNQHTAVGFMVRKLF